MMSHTFQIDSVMVKRKINVHLMATFRQRCVIITILLLSYVLIGSLVAYCLISDDRKLNQNWNETCYWVMIISPVLYNGQCTQTDTSLVWYGSSVHNPQTDTSLVWYGSSVYSPQTDTSLVWYGSSVHSPQTDTCLVWYGSSVHRLILV